MVQYLEDRETLSGSPMSPLKGSFNGDVDVGVDVDVDMDLEDRETQ